LFGGNSMANDNRPFRKDLTIAIIGGLFVICAAVITARFRPDVVIYITESFADVVPTVQVVERVITVTPGPEPTAQIIEVALEVTREIEVEVTREIEVEVTREVMITVEHIITATPIPTATPTPLPEITLAGTILDVGDTWRHEGRQLRLLDVGYGIRFGQPTVSAYFQFTNRTTQTLFVSCESTDFVATTNTALRVLANGWGNSYCRGELAPQVSMLIGPEGRLRFEVDYFPPDLTEIIITVTEVGGIPEARWRLVLDK
jgi:hypothetical protein